MAGVVRQLFQNFRNLHLCNNKLLNLKTVLQPSLIGSAIKQLSTVPTPYEIVDSKEDNLASKALFNKVQDLVSNNKQGRLFAVVHLAGKQFKVTEGDVIVVEGYWPPTAGDKISLDKVLSVRHEDYLEMFTSVAAVQDGLVNVHATVIEKTLSHTKTHFRFKRRKQYRRIHFFRVQQTMLRINSIKIVGEINKPPSVTGLETAIL